MKLHINNLSPKVTEFGPRELLGQYGPVHNIEIAWRRVAGRDGGTAIVEMNMGDARRAARELTSRPFCSRRLYIALMADGGTAGKELVGQKLKLNQHEWREDALIKRRSAIKLCRIKSENAKKLRQTLNEFHTYIENNQRWIPNYGERFRAGESISSAFLESTVDQVVSRRMVKKQQMRWRRHGAHLLLQVRTRELNGEVRQVIKGRYPAFDPQEAEQAQAA